MKKALKSAVCVAVFCVIAACGGGGGGSPAPAPATTTSNLAAPATPATVAAVVNTPFTFSGGVPAFGTTKPTTVAFTGTGTTPAFSISSTEGTATGSTTFGSCIFRVVSSTFPAGSPLAKDQTVRVDPCSLNVQTAGATANGTPSSRDIGLLLGTLTSAPTSITVTVAADGSVTINGTGLGTVTVQQVTGGA